MNSKGILSYTVRIAIIITAYVTLVFSTTTVKQDLDTYFAKIDETLTTIQKSSAVKSTDLRLAENLFFRELKKNQPFYAFYRANSKGKIVSEVVRSKPAERTGTIVENEQWYKTVKKNNEDFYTVFKDEDRGRYYLIWSKPILKKEQFKGVVCLKVDLWDCFYDYSNGIYFPILVKLGKKTLFSHKWNDVIRSTEESLIVPGIKNISVRYISEKKAEIIQDTVAKALPAKDTVIAKTDSSLIKKAKVMPAPKKGNNGGFMIFLIIAGIAAVVIVIVMIALKKRKDGILKKIEQDDF
jgi:hypothetical protein